MSPPLEELSAFERNALRWLLPEARAGYDSYYRDLASLSILGPGRWGAGDYIFGPPGDTIDLSGPMERVFASGIIEFASRRVTLTVHEKEGGQIEVQFAATGADPVPGEAEMRRYCWSYWAPGEPAPASGTRPREIRLSPAGSGDAWVLAISREDERVWLHYSGDGVNHLIPLTSFHAELMRHLEVRDADVALHPRLLFDRHAEYADGDLIEALKRYNMRTMKLPLPHSAPEAASGPPSWRSRLFRR